MKAWDILASNPELQGLLESSVKDDLKYYFDSRNRKKNNFPGYSSPISCSFPLLTFMDG